MKRLFVVGNGFDLAHGRKTSYNDFRDYLVKQNYSRFVSSMEFRRGLMADGIWNDVEVYMGYVHENEQKMATDYAFDLQGALKEWMARVEAEPAKKLPANFSRKDLFITFNYTNTLEDLYGVSDCQILHLHGSYKNGDSLVMGHRCRHESSNLDVYDQLTYKPVELIINERLEPFLKEYIHPATKHISQAVILGHGIRTCDWVDRGYFKYLAKSLKDAKWHVSCLNPDDSKEKEKALIEIGINEKLIKFGKLEELMK